MPDEISPRDPFLSARISGNNIAADVFGPYESLSDAAAVAHDLDHRAHHFERAVDATEDAGAEAAADAHDAAGRRCRSLSRHHAPEVDAFFAEGQSMISGALYGGSAR